MDTFNATVKLSLWPVVSVLNGTEPMNPSF